jgi:hypothetical protein
VPCYKFIAEVDPKKAHLKSFNPLQLDNIRSRIRRHFPAIVAPDNVLNDSKFHYILALITHAVIGNRLRTSRCNSCIYVIHHHTLQLQHSAR